MMSFFGYSMLKFLIILLNYAFQVQIPSAYTLTCKKFLGRLPWVIEDFLGSQTLHRVRLQQPDDEVTSLGTYFVSLSGNVIINSPNFVK